MPSYLLPTDLQARALTLGPYLTEATGSEIQIEKAVLASEGMSAVTLLLKVEDADDLVVRFQLGTQQESIEARQFAVLEAVRSQGVPAPQPVAYEPDGTVLGEAFLVTSLLPGASVTPWTRQGRERLNAIGRGVGGRQLVDILAAIHRTPVPPGLPRCSANSALRELRNVVEEHSRHPEPILVDAFGWLANNLPSEATPVLIHGDYRAGNLLFDEDRITGVLDWELAHAGDPAEDIAWLISKANRASGSLACDMVPLDTVLASYKQASGRDIDPRSVKFWDIFGLVRLTASWLSTTAAWRRGELKDVRIARWTYNLPKLRQMVLTELEKADHEY